MSFARHQFELSQPQEDGEPLLAHLKAYERRNGPHPMLAGAPAQPKGTEQLWRDFLELHDSRGSTGWGAARITFNDLFAWQKVRGVMLEAWEVDLIRKADNLWMSEFAPKPKADA